MCIYTSKANATVHVAMMDKEYLEFQREQYEQRIEKEQEKAAAAAKVKYENTEAKETKAKTAETVKSEKTEETVKTDTVSETKKSTPGNFTEEEIELLYKICHAESCGESTKGQMAVANVILNRVKSSKFPDTIKGVIFQKGQFTPAAGKSFYSIEPSSQVRESVQRVIDGERVLDDDVLYFKSTNSGAKWGSYTLEARIGRHLFYSN